MKGFVNWLALSLQPSNFFSINIVLFFFNFQTKFSWEVINFKASLQLVQNGISVGCVWKILIHFVCFLSFKFRWLVPKV